MMVNSNAYLLPRWSLTLYIAVIKLITLLIIKISIDFGNYLWLHNRLWLFEYAYKSIQHDIVFCVHSALWSRVTQRLIFYILYTCTRVIDCTGRFKYLSFNNYTIIQIRKKVNGMLDARLYCIIFILTLEFPRKTIVSI